MSEGRCTTCGKWLYTERDRARVAELEDAIERICNYDSFQGGPIAPRATPTEQALREIAESVRVAR